MGGKDEVKLLSAWYSPFCARAIIALHAKGVPFECVEEDLQNKSQLLLESNWVHKKVPVLIHNGKAIQESLVIMEYIDEAWPSDDGKDLLPKNSYHRSLARFWADYIDRKVEQTGRRVLYTCGEEQEKAVQELSDALVPLDQALGVLSDGKLFFSGDHVGYVDIVFASLTPGISAMEILFDVEIFDAQKLPNLTKWVQRVYEEPCVQEAYPDPLKIIDIIQTARERVLGAR